MIRQAVNYVKDLPGTAADKAAALKQLLDSIATKVGNWNYGSMRGADGSYIFTGGKGETVVINSAGEVFRGNIARIPTAMGPGFIPDYSKFTKLQYVRL